MKKRETRSLPFSCFLNFRPSDQCLQYLHGIERRPFFDLIADAPERQAILAGQGFADTPHVYRLLAGDEQLSEWARITGTRTHVADTAMSECMILRVS